MFSIQSDDCIPICPYFWHRFFAVELEEPEIGVSGKGLNGPDKVSFRKHWEENGNSWKLAFSPFPRMFSTFTKTCFIISPAFYVMSASFLTLPNDKILDLTKLKAFAEDIINATWMLCFVFDRVENIVENGEKMLVSSIVKLFLSVLLKPGIVW